LRDWRWERLRSKIYVGLSCGVFVGVALWGGGGQLPKLPLLL